MKTTDYIKLLIKEKDEFKELSEKHLDTIRTLNKMIIKLNNEKNDSDNIELKNEIDRLNKELNILKVENDNLKNMCNEFVQKNEELNKIKSNPKKLKSDYIELQLKYEEVVRKNKELMDIFESIENSDSEDSY